MRMTIGETRVRLTFNPESHSAVDIIKRRTADLIDFCEANKDKDPRLAELAMTAYEEAAMWAVKLATA
jgi:hypothetical protein